MTPCAKSDRQPLRTGTKGAIKSGRLPSSPTVESRARGHVHNAAKDKRHPAGHLACKRETAGLRCVVNAGSLPAGSRRRPRGPSKPAPARGCDDARAAAFTVHDGTPRGLSETLQRSKAAPPTVMVARRPVVNASCLSAAALPPNRGSARILKRAAPLPPRASQQDQREAFTVHDAGRADCCAGNAEPACLAS